MKLIDLVLFSHADRELVPIRIKELHRAVDLIILVETEFRFSNPPPGWNRWFKKTSSAFNRSWLSLAPNVRRWVVRYRSTDFCSLAALRANPHENNSRLKRTPLLYAGKCRESFGRNNLYKAFAAYGGRDSDIAFVSDADEIPRVEAIPLARAAVLADPNVSVSLGAVHHFRYTLQCERPWREGAPGATWLKGPVAASGALLRQIGPQAVRTLDGCVSNPFIGSCQSPVKRLAIANASWHLSSISGGLAGVMTKLNQNAAQALLRPMVARPSAVMARAAHCQHLEPLDSVNAKHYTRTRWEARRVPRYPDIPAALEAAFRSGQLLHYLGWPNRTESNNPLNAVSTGLAWDDEVSTAPIGVVYGLEEFIFHATAGPCTSRGCNVPQAAASRNAGARRSSPMRRKSINRVAQHGTNRV